MPQHKQTPKRAAFLAAYAKMGNVSGAAKAAKISRLDHYAWLKAEDHEYAELFAAAQEEAIDTLEQEAVRRAMIGSDVLLIFLLKGARPDKYRERREITGAGGGPLLVVTGPGQ